MPPLNNLTRASVAPVSSRSISGDPVRRGAAILISSEAVARRSGSARSWAGADPSPACAMRARRNEIHLGSRHAGSARQNPPALNPREPASHNAIPGDITKTTPPGAGAGRGRREGAGVSRPLGGCEVVGPLVAGALRAHRVPTAARRDGGGRPDAGAVDDVGARHIPHGSREIGRASCRERV